MDTIDHKFLLSEWPGFWLIEKKESKKHVPNEWAKVLSAVRKKQIIQKLLLMKPADFFSIKRSKSVLTNRKKTTEDLMKNRNHVYTVYVFK